MGLECGGRLLEIDEKRYWEVAERVIRGTIGDYKDVDAVIFLVHWGNNQMLRKVVRGIMDRNENGRVVVPHEGGD
jgi:hypothetical protein